MPTFPKKRCTRCGIEKNLEQYGISKRVRSGRVSWCIQCTRAYKSNWVENNGERYHQLKREASCYPAARFRQGVNNSKRKSLTWGISFEEYVMIVSSGECHYCGELLPRTGSGLDRKNNALGYTIDNVVPCCFDCNTTKRNFFTYEEMLEIGAVIRRRHLRKAVA